MNDHNQHANLINHLRVIHTFENTSYQVRLSLVVPDFTRAPIYFIRDHTINIIRLKMVSDISTQICKLNHSKEKRGGGNLKLTTALFKTIVMHSSHLPLRVTYKQYLSSLHKSKLHLVC